MSAYSLPIIVIGTMIIIIIIVIIVAVIIIALRLGGLGCPVWGFRVQGLGFTASCFTFTTRH